MGKVADVYGTRKIGEVHKKESAWPAVLGGVFIVLLIIGLGKAAKGNGTTDSSAAPSSVTTK